MSDTADTVIHPVSASADGKRNSYSRRCSIVEQVMNYAACQWRQSVIGHPKVNVPADWTPCVQAGKDGTCPALTMLSEEYMAGKAIYFVERFNPSLPSSTTRRWGEKAVSVFGSAVGATPVAKSKAKPSHALDSIADAGDYADAITAYAVTTPTPAPTPAPKEEPASAPVRAPVALAVPKPTQAPMPVALPGESPLAMARRLHAAKLAAAS